MILNKYSNVIRPGTETQPHDKLKIRPTKHVEEPEARSTIFGWEPRQKISSHSLYHLNPHGSKQSFVTLRQGIAQSMVCLTNSEKEEATSSLYKAVLYIW